MNAPVQLESALQAKVERLREQLADIATRYQPVAFASSLGAEDQLITDLIAKHQLPIEVFSLDTGRLPTETYDLLAQTRSHYPGLDIAIYSPRHDLIEPWVRQNGINAFYDSVENRKACCGIRKVEPLSRALAGKKAWITGMRAQQSATRDGLPLQQFDEGHGIEKFNPLTEWTEKEVWAYLRAYGVPYNALHDRFYPSIGCAPCTRAITPGEDVRSGRWWWENPDTKECGLHVKK